MIEKESYTSTNNYKFHPNKLAQQPWENILSGGCYDAIKLADLIQWSSADMAKYLRKSASALSRQSSAKKDQEFLGELVQLLDYALEIAGGKIDALVAWLKTRIWALDNKSAKDMIIDHKLERVRNLLDEIESGSTA